MSIENSKNESVEQNVARQLTDGSAIVNTPQVDNVVLQNTLKSTERRLLAFAAFNPLSAEYLANDCRRQQGKNVGSVLRTTTMIFAMEIEILLGMSVCKNTEGKSPQRTNRWKVSARCRRAGRTELKIPRIRTTLVGMSTSMRTPRSIPSCT